MRLIGSLAGSELSLRRGMRSACAIIVTTAVLAGCGGRPGPETLLPVANPGPGKETVTLLAVTNRTPSVDVPPVLTSERGNPSYEEFTMLERADAEDTSKKPSSDPSENFVTVGRRVLSKGAFDERVSRMAAPKDTAIAVFVHGYNYSYQEAVFRLAQLTADGGQDAVPVLFSWPSEGSATGYLADRDAAAYARDDLVTLLTQLTQQHPNRDIALVGHSMGAWLVMETLRQLRLEKRNAVLNRLNVVLAAPDIDMDVFRKQADVVGPLNPPLTLMVAANDRALAASGRLAGSRTRVGQASPVDPQLVAIAERGRMRVMDISAAPASGALNHDKYAGLAAQWSRLADGQEQPDGIRRAGIYVLGTTGQILSAPFSVAAEILGGP